jgi:tetratricopeptide (TPR) repeat protein
MELADVDEAARCLTANEALVIELGQPALAWPVMMQRAGLLLLRGEIDAAEAAFLAAYERGVATGQPDAPIQLVAQQFSVRYDQGTVGELEDTFRSIAERVAMVKAIFAALLVETDRLVEARQVFDELADSGFAVPFDFVWLRFATDLASVCARLGDQEGASVIHGMLEPYADRLASIILGSVVTGSVSFYLGLLSATMGRFEEAEARFAAAEAVHARIGAPAWLARTRLEWAGMLLTRRQHGDAKRARGLLGQALETARERGLGNVERRAVALLQ